MKTKKESLLMVLKHPEIPLHSNPTELEARQRVRKRDISFGPRTKDGIKAWDTFMSLAATAKKLGISFYQYIHGRVSKANEIPALASLIEARASELELGASWSVAQLTDLLSCYVRMVKSDRKPPHAELASRAGQGPLGLLFPAKIVPLSRGKSKRRTDRLTCFVDLTGRRSVEERSSRPYSYT